MRKYKCVYPDNPNTGQIDSVVGTNISLRAQMVLCGFVCPYSFQVHSMSCP